MKGLCVLLAVILTVAACAKAVELSPTPQRLPGSPSAPTATPAGEQGGTTIVLRGNNPQDLREELQKASLSGFLSGERALSVLGASETGETLGSGSLSMNRRNSVVWLMDDETGEQRQFTLEREGGIRPVVKMKNKQEQKEAKVPLDLSLFLGNISTDQFVRIGALAVLTALVVWLGAHVGIGILTVVSTIAFLALIAGAILVLGGTFKVALNTIGIHSLQDVEALFQRAIEKLGEIIEAAARSFQKEREQTPAPFFSDLPKASFPHPCWLAMV